jgi:hypothetical protein
MPDVEARIVVGLFAIVVQAAVDQVLDLGLVRELKEADAPVGLGLFTELEAVRVDENPLRARGGGEVGVDVVGVGGWIDDHLDVGEPGILERLGGGGSAREDEDVILVGGG